MTAVRAHTRASAPKPPDAATLCSLVPEERYRALDASPSGLSSDEAARRMARYGPNAVHRAASFSWMRALVANFTHPLALLLWFGAVMAFAAEAPELTAAIAAVVVINGAFALIQEYRAERVVEALLARAALSARAVRAGTERLVPAAQLVPGDLVALTAGDVVPADCVLVHADGLSLDLSLLTGETTPVGWSVDAADSTAGGSRLACMAPAGAGVVRGSARALVAATGRASTIGRVEALLVEPERGSSLLERQVAGLSRLTAAIAALCGAATLSLAIAFRGTGIVAALTFGMGVIVALVPEGLLPLLTMSLAMSARRMAARGALVRRLSAIEVIGESTVICTDKTGTLTQNTLAVLAFVPWRRARDAEARARLIAALCNDAREDAGGSSGDPIDRALLAWIAASNPGALRARHPRAAAMPFDPVRRYMRVDCEFPGGARQLVKGAPEAVAALVGAPLPAELAAAIARAAGHGERVLLLADGPAGASPEYVGVVRFHDPPRREVPGALAACRRAGVRVLMLTGDHPATALAVAERIGLADEHATVLEGADIDALDDRALADRLRGSAILARTTPEQKLRIVRALQEAGEVVTVTGDGVNDAPALRIADVGIAMGRRGTEVAKQASDIVLLDDNFATIVAAIEEGRTIKHNIRRFASYVFTSNVAEL
ncbi:MAG TPA: cation-transporting P-type ATPase, partial [Kofleriaceae bacterium]|nr:cation-transporting P-type ATPase [Kofleriaceae bacterium]